MPSRFVTGALLLAVLAAGTVACARPESGGHAEGAARAHPAAVARTPVPFTPPVPALSDGEQRRLDRAENRLVDACLKRKGIDVAPAKPPRPGPLSREIPAWNPYALLTDDLADRDGYGLTSPVLRGEPPSDREPERETSAGEAEWDRAMDGTDAHRESVRLPTGGSVSRNTDGCRFRGGEELYGEGWDRLLYGYQFLANEVVAEAGRAPGVTAARARWSACVTESGLGKLGHRPGKPERLRERVAERLDAARGDGAALERVARTELDAARADARCQRESRLREAVTAAQREAERPALAAHGELIADYARALRAALRD
ncbi:hypothetical protein [Streptomyces sp. HNM0574]|uniref:hypothetical protein n=1 Tax=Streptomyces sp. HNM0574 TaxID=2714954 RepID=UPI00146BED01|nr:hypothetical protein [Streptomyces sp. HNM0574]NLU66787.1 hypothetical protein [Streptomyces sp. HNM0574]